jgi:pimeloyl-[acyl-carrier protein] methyl ester esterase
MLVHSRSSAPVTDKPQLALLPGLDGTGELFFPILPLLRERFEVHVLSYGDEPGFDDYVASAAEQLPGGVPLSLVAESFSGPVAISLLASKRFDFGPSVLCATFCKSPLPVLSRLAGYMPEKLFGSHALSRTVVDLWVTGSGAEPTLVGKAQELLHRVAPETFKRRIGIVDDIDVSEELKSVEVPLLYIQATRDRVVFADSGAEIVKQAQDIRLEKVDGSHMILQTRPERCAELIVEHVLGTRDTESGRTTSPTGGISQ